MTVEFIDTLDLQYRSFWRINLPIRSNIEYNFGPGLLKRIIANVNKRSKKAYFGANKYWYRVVGFKVYEWKHGRWMYLPKQFLSEDSPCSK